MPKIGNIAHKNALIPANDVSCEESTAVAVFQAVAEGEVEPCIFQDVIYDTLP